MFKIWAKLLDDDRNMIKNANVTFEDKFNPDKLEEYIRVIAHTFDIPNPIVLSYHINSYRNFNFVKFSRSDFVEHTSFCFLTLENGK